MPARFETATGNPAAERRGHRSRRATPAARPTSSASATASTRLDRARPADRWPVFDLPFEDDRRPESLSILEPLRRCRAAAPPTGPDGSAASKPHRADAARTVLSVTELTVRVRDLLETEFFEVWVEGELSNCRLWNTGHLYFTLKDAASQMRGFMFRSALRYLKFKPDDGLRVVARGRISRLRAEGRISARLRAPRAAGARRAAARVRAAEEAACRPKACSTPARKRPLPALPRKIGIVTSLDGAAIRDIIKVLARRHAQRAHRHPAAARAGRGRGASKSRARSAAIARVPGVDVVIVGRGGGSIEDLWAFNEEIVARAIATSPVPVISAVGHETDVTIADFVADLRAPTPSAAAEIVVAAKDEFCGTHRSTGRSPAGRASRNRIAARQPPRARRSAAARRSPAFPGRVAMRGRHAAELTHALGAVHARRSSPARERRLRPLRRQLDTFDLGRRLAGDPHAARRAPTAAWTAARHAAAPRRSAAGAKPPAGSNRSARWPCSAAATRSAGMPTGPRCSATRPTCRRATASASRWPGASSTCDVREATDARPEN